MKDYLEIGPENNRHSHATRFSSEWMTMGLSDKNTDLDVAADMDHRWPFMDNSFKIVFASHVLEHAKNPVHFISEAYRVTVQGGTVRLNVPDAKWLCHRYVVLKRKTLFQLIRNLRSWHGAPEHKAHWHPFDTATLEALFKYGFYPMLGIEPTEKSLDDPATLFADVKIVESGKSREEIMRAGYFGTRYERTIYCEGTK